MKTQTRDANAPVETETRDAQRSRDFFFACAFFSSVVFFFCFFVFVFFGLVFFPPINCEELFFFGRRLVCCWSHTQKSFVSFRFVSFLFFLRLMNRTTTKKRHKKRVRDDTRT